MKRVTLSLVRLHSESEDPTVELDANQEILSAQAGLVAGHASFDVLVATTVEYEKPQEAEATEPAAATLAPNSVEAARSATGSLPPFAPQPPSADLG